MQKIKSKERSNTRDRLILAGLDELTEHGVANFSTRRVAQKCGVSCAAPYKHFKDTNDFISEVLGYIDRKYRENQRKVLKQCADLSYKEQLIILSVEYIRFLAEHREFRKIIMQNYQDCSEEYCCLRAQLSVKTYELVSKYCEEVNMPPDVRKRKTFIVRSIIYSAALFFDTGELEYNDENMKMVSDMLAREFDLP